MLFPLKFFPRRFCSVVQRKAFPVSLSSSVAANTGGMVLWNWTMISSLCYKIE